MCGACRADGVEPRPYAWYEGAAHVEWGDVGSVPYAFFVGAAKERRPMGRRSMGDGEIYSAVTCQTLPFCTSLRPSGRKKCAVSSTKVTGASAVMPSLKRS